MSQLDAEHPQFAHLSYMLSLAERAMRIASWLPLTPKEVLALADKPNLKLVTSPADLCAVLLRRFKNYANLASWRTDPGARPVGPAETKHIFRR